MDFRYSRPPSSDPYQPQVPPPPGTSYSGQFQYNSPPQWAPQPQPPPPPYAAAPPPPPPPMPYSASHYSIPPRPNMHPPPQPHYPHFNQEWSNPGWGQQGYNYSGHNKNEDDWAARARAWAASKTVTDDQHQLLQSAPANLPEEANYQNQYTQNVEYQQHSVPTSSYQQYSSSYALPPRPPANHFQEPPPPPPPSFSSGYGSDGHLSYPARDGNLQDPAAVYPHQEMTSGHQQEVPSSYSSVAGNEEPNDMNRNFYPPSHMAFSSAPQHQVQPSFSPNERSIPVEQPHYSFNNSSAESATDLSNQPLDFGPRYGHDHGPFVQSGVPGMPYPSMPPVHATIHQADPSVGVSSPTSLNSTPLFGRISSFQPTMPPANTTFPIGTSNAFHGDTYGTPGFSDRPKKASVPNWLREEIIKKKAVIGSSAPEVSRQDTESNEDDVMDQKGDRVGGKSTDSTQSAEEEGDDEDYVEATRTAEVNQEIKRILTEVLLKVTDELFDEIATNVLDEDDLNVEVERKADNASAAVTPKSTAKVIIPTNTKGADVDDASGKSSFSSPGDVLGLGNYASDDDEEEEEKEVKNTSVPSSNSSKQPVHLSENGSSQVDDGDVLGKKFLEESGSQVSPNGAIESHNERLDGEKIKPDNSDFSKSMQSVNEGGPKAKNSSQDDSQGRILRNGPDSSKDKKHNKVDANSRTHDERHIKRAKQEDQNGSKEKLKDQDSGKKVSKAEVKDDKEERERDKRSRDKEDSRKRDKGKDEKNERTKYKSVGDSSRRKRHHSPSPGGRGRSSKDNSSVSHAHGSSDSSSGDSRRKVRSKRRDLSPSPVRSRRQVSRSPSKRSHRRHSIYSSLETTRESRRSRSRSRSRSRRG